MTGRGRSSRPRWPLCDTPSPTAHERLRPTSVMSQRAIHLTPLDWGIVVLSLVICYLPAAYYARRAGRNTTEFFTSGRAAPWWLIGVSMVATTFSTDTPNLVTNFVRTAGVANNW